MPNSLRDLEPRMRVIYQTPPTPITLVYQGTGPQYRGLGYLVVTLLEPGEEPPLVPGTKITYPNGRPLAALRAEGNGRVIAMPGPSFRRAMEPVTIPESVLTSVPDDAKLYFAWRFSPGAV